MQAMQRWLDPILNPLACLPQPEPSAVAQEKAEAMLKRLEVLLQHRLRYALAGDRHSILKGQGLDFADLREYMPGDDIRKMDWNVFARTLTPHIREYQEEKQLTLWLTVDFTPSMHFGKGKTKLQQALDLAGLLGLLAHRGNHQLGAFLILGQNTQIIPPKTGYPHLQFILQTFIDQARSAEALPAPLPAGEDLFPAACQQLSHLVRKNSTIVVLSDFLATSDAWKMPLGQLSRHNTLIYLLLTDPVETQLPAGLGLLNLIDPESGQVIQVDTRDAAFRQAYAQEAMARQEAWIRTLKQTGLATPASTHQDPLEILLALLSSGRSAA